MKFFLLAGLLVSSAFFAQAQANEINGNNDCNQAIRSDNCLQNGRNTGGGQQPPVIVQPQPNPPVVQLQPHYNHYDGGYGQRWDRNRRQGGLYFNFQTDPYPYDNTYNEPDYYDDPYYNDGPNYYSEPNSRRYHSYSRTRLSKCSSIAKSLRYSGYSKVRNQKCTGRNYIYTASRDGERHRLTVSSSSGRIIKIRVVN